MMTMEGFLIGFIACASLTAGVFFLKFWRDTRDSLFLAFAASFLIEGVNRVSTIFLPNPSEGSTVHYLVRSVSFLLIIIAIINKNYARKP